MIEQVLESGKATLRELRECYGLHDLYVMWEVVYAEKYRAWQQAEARKKASETRNRR